MPNRTARAAALPDLFRPAVPALHRRHVRADQRRQALRGRHAAAPGRRLGSDRHLAGGVHALPERRRLDLGAPGADPGQGDRRARRIRRAHREDHRLGAHPGARPRPAGLRGGRHARADGARARGRRLLVDQALPRRHDRHRVHRPVSPASPRQQASRGAVDRHHRRARTARRGGLPGTVHRRGADRGDDPVARPGRGSFAWPSARAWRAPRIAGPAGIRRPAAGAADYAALEETSLALAARSHRHFENLVAGPAAALGMADDTATGRQAR